MLRRALLLVSAILVFGALAGCKSDQEAGCERLSDCDLLFLVGEDSTRGCVAEVEDALNDGRVDGDALSRCVDCLNNNECSEIRAGDCSVACDDLAP